MTIEGGQLGLSNEDPKWMSQYVPDLPCPKFQGTVVSSFLQICGLLFAPKHDVKWGAPTKAPAACCQALLMTSANFRVWKHCWQCDFWNVKGVISLYHLRRVCLSPGFRCHSAPSQQLSLLRHHLPQLIAPNWQGGFFHLKIRVNGTFLLSFPS